MNDKRVGVREKRSAWLSSWPAASKPVLFTPQQSAGVFSQQVTIFIFAFWRCARRRPPLFDEPRSFPTQRLQPVEPVLVQLVFSITRTVQVGENLSSLSSPARPTSRRRPSRRVGTFARPMPAPTSRTSRRRAWAGCCTRRGTRCNRLPRNSRTGVVAPGGGSRSFPCPCSGC